MSEQRKIKFKTLDSKITELTVDAKIPITELKQKIKEIFNAPPEGQRLIFRGKQMKDGQTLDEHIKEDNEIIHLMFKTPEQLQAQAPQGQNQSNTASVNPNPQIGTFNFMDTFNSLLSSFQNPLGANATNSNPQGTQSQQPQQPGQGTQPQVDFQNILSQGLGNMGVVFTNVRPTVSVTAINPNSINIPRNTNSQPQTQSTNTNQQNQNQQQSSTQFVNENNMFPIQMSENDRRYENFLRQINANISNCQHTLQTNGPSVPLPLLNTTQNILTAISRSLRYYILGLQDLIPNLMRLSELLEREQLITNVDDRRKANDLMKRCGLALNDISKASTGVSKVLNSGSFGVAPNGGFVSVVSAEVGAITTEISIPTNPQINTTNSNTSPSTNNTIPTQPNHTTSQNIPQPIPTETSSNTNTTPQQSTTPNQTNPSNDQNQFGNIMAQVLRPENLNSIMGMVDNIIGGGNNQGANANANPLANIVNNIMTQLDQNESNPSTIQQPQPVPSSSESNKDDIKVEEIKDENKKEEPKKEEKKEDPNKEESPKVNVNEVIKKIMSSPNTKRQTHINDIEKDLPLNPHQEFASFTKKIIAYLSFQEIENLKKMNIIGITRQRKEIQSLIKDLPTAISKVSELLFERFILYENELDKLSPNKSFDIEEFYKKHMTSILSIVVNDKLSDSEWEDSLRKALLKMIRELNSTLSEVYQTGKEGAKYCIESNLEVLLIDVLGKDFLSQVQNYYNEILGDFIDTVIVIAENDAMKEEMTSNESEDRLLSIDEIFKVAMNDKKKLENENNNNTQEKFSEMYYRTSMFQD